MEDLIMNVHTLYDEHTNHPSPPLPPTPAGEPVPYFAYGSKRTKVASMPPTHTTSGPYPLSLPQDFTPRLPPRPTNSIHPSLRAGAPSPTRGRAETPQPSQRRHDRSSHDESPPPSPSATLTIYETDDPSSGEPAIPEQLTTPATNVRSRSPLRSVTTEMTEAPQPDDAPPAV
jgi:hypothetical protein